MGLDGCQLTDLRVGILIFISKEHACILASSFYAVADYSTICTLSNHLSEIT